ncbi:MAG: hypothetical protein KAS96_02625 [Planctomycetes bacterium]|nr:hypothetical protein [Planctomycetota bacterium]
MNETDNSQATKDDKQPSPKTKSRKKKVVIILFCVFGIPTIFLLFSAWILSHTCEIAQHNINGSTSNEVYLHQDGHSEAVFDSSGNPVTDEENKASYNYYHPQKQPLRHFCCDTLPWLMWGNSEKDKTTKSQRLKAFLTDLKHGIIKAFNRQ